MKFLLPVLLLAGCTGYPRDIEGTLDRVETSGAFRVGIIAGNDAPADYQKIGAYLAHVGNATRARPQLMSGAAEPLLLRLEQGQLDLVIGPVSATSPWATDVAIIEPITTRPLGEDEVTLSPIARNGENAWIMLLEREVRDMASGA